jgi:hypothetical protein
MKLTIAVLNEISVSREMSNNILRDLEGSKGGSNDGVRNKLLNLVADSIDRPLCLLFRKIIQTGTFPDCWKLGTIVPIY